MALCGWDPVIYPAKVDERCLPGEDPAKYVLRVAECKAQAILQQAPQDALVVAADTTVVDWEQVEGSLQVEDNLRKAVILGKPKDQYEACAMLRSLRGRSHQVYTGIVVIRAADRMVLRDVTVTEVAMRDYSEQELVEYAHSGDPLDKAGAYAIQHTGFHPVEQINGCYANVMGLPVCSLAGLLLQFGIQPVSPIVAACRASLGINCQIEETVFSVHAASMHAEGVLADSKISAGEV